MLERALNRIMLVVIASRFPETEKPLPLKTEKCHNIGCLYSISGFLMALTAALKAQIAAWYKALQEQIPDFIPRAPQRQMIADVAKTLAGEEGRHLAIEAPTGVGKTLSYLIPGIAIAREEQKTLVVSTANVALQDQIYSKDLPLLKKIIPDLKFTAAFGRGRYVCPRNLTALASTEPTQQDLLAFLDDELTPNNQEEQKRCAKLKGDLDTYKWDGLRDHTDIAIDDDLWRRLSTDKASCLNRNCYYYRECPFFVARREIQEAEVVVANHALVMAAMESEAVLPDPKNLLLVLDEGHHLPDVARDALEMSAEITAPWYRLQLDLFTKLVATCMEQFRPKTIPPLAIPERLNAHCEELYELIASLNNILNLYMPAGQEAEHRFAMGELPDEVLEICQRLAKLTEMLRGLAELFLNDLSEKTGSHDIVRLHRLILQMNRALGDVRGAKQTLAAGFAGAIFRCTGDQMGDAGRARRAATPLVSLRGNTCQRSAGKAAVAQYSAHYCHLRNLAFAEQFFAFAGDEWSERESGATVLWRWIPPLTTANRAKLLFPGCALSLPSTTKSSILPKWRPFSVSRWRAKNISVCWYCLPADGRCSAFSTM
ncbi:ATP-dependent DNA helicase DinG [Escherichia coli]|nr:ATP-dependent DNA helicase DinG [Escherichia coli]